MAYSRFQKGSGVFKCTCCGRRTRETTSDNSEVCGPCYELAGYENGVSDCGVGHIADYLAGAVQEYKTITSKGGVYTFDQSPELGIAVRAAIEAGA